MANGITIMSSEAVTDSAEANGNKRCIAFALASSALISDVLAQYPGAGNGSVAICAAEGFFKTLIDGVWV